jgi:hypothetical protein
MERTQIIQHLINKCSAKKYLEIGMGGGHNFHSIRCEYKVSVDPNPTVHVTHRLTSDEFFNQNKEIFDVIFIDGLHMDLQVYRDILNSLSCLSENGYIICHDMSPMEELIQRYPQPMVESPWTGDCWKAWVKLKSERTDLDMVVVDTDYGCGVISKGNQDLIRIDEELTWDFLDRERKKILNLISVNEFLEKYA